MNREASAGATGNCPASKNSVERELVYDNYLDLPVIIGAYPESIDCYDWGSRTPASYGNLKLGPGERRTLIVDDNNTTRMKGFNVAVRVVLSPGVMGGGGQLRLGLNYWQAASLLMLNLYGGTEVPGNSPAGPSGWCSPDTRQGQACVQQLDLPPKTLEKTGGPVQARVAYPTLAIERAP